MIGMLISLLVLAIIAGLCWWILGMLPLPPPFKNVVMVIFLLICLVYLVSMLLGAAPSFPAFHGYR
jgi:hypothetical protein